MKIYAPAPITCTECGYTTNDLYLVAYHSCAVAQNGGRCEDYPCCGHELGDCNGELYGSDEAIKAQVEAAWVNGHGFCDHESGIYNCSDDGREEDEDDEDDSDEANISIARYRTNLEGEEL